MDDRELEAIGEELIPTKSKGEQDTLECIMELKGHMAAFLAEVEHKKKDPNDTGWSDLVDMDSKPISAKALRKYSGLPPGYSAFLHGQTREKADRALR